MGFKIGDKVVIYATGRYSGIVVDIVGRGILVKVTSDGVPYRGVYHSKQLRKIGPKKLPAKEWWINIYNNGKTCTWYSSEENAARAEDYDVEERLHVKEISHE